MNIRVGNLLKILFIIAIFFLSFNAVNVYANSASSNSVAHVALVLSTGGLGDKSFNDVAFAGAQKANDTSKVQIDYVEPKTVDEINTYIESFAASTNPAYDLIIAVGFSAAGGVNASSIAHPNRNFAIIDDNSISRSNVVDITFKGEEGSFLVGAMAAMVSLSGTIGFLGGLNIPLINKFFYGYEQGAHYINPNINVLHQYSPDPNNPWGDVAGGKVVANTEISQGADVIYASAGGTGLGVFDAVNESRQNGKLVYGIGVDSDQDYLAPGLILTSMVKRVDVAVYDLIGSTIDGSYQYLSQNTVLGLGLNGVGISPMMYTQFIKNSLCTNSETRFNVIQKLNSSIINGDIVVSSTAPTSFNTVSHACTNDPPNPQGLSGITTAITSSSGPVLISTSQSTSVLISNGNNPSSTSTPVPIPTTPSLTILYLIPALLLFYKRKRRN